ncbi:DivIVA domain-containing protein [Streptomyces sp. NPDC020807]|uniref:DivIVA domain-containing protein n=1 Tax=Streptomyces sp. NPDC020807 TaxID=3155119 RepID=UPI0033E3AE07
MPLTPEDVRNKQFTTVRLREGYDEDEVDAFLDEVEAELTRLLRENEDLRAKLAAATRAAAQNQQQGMRKPPEPQDRPVGPGAPVPAAISGPPVQQQQPQMGPPQLPSGAPALPAGPMQGGPMQGGPMGPGPMQGGPMQGGPMGPGPMQGGPMGHPQQQMQPQMQQQPPQAPGGDSAARVLSLAQQTADQAIAEARSEANKIVGEARSRAEGLERDARAKADALERDAQEKHRVAMGSLESARATLERKVEDLRGFEREYRTRLKSYLESQLRQLETQADDSLAPPRTPATASLPPAPSMASAGASAPSYGGGAPSMGGAPSYGGQQQMSPAMTQPMAPVRPQAPQPMQQAPAPMRGFLIDEDDN